MKSKPLESATTCTGRSTAKNRKKGLSVTCSLKDSTVGDSSSSCSSDGNKNKPRNVMVLDATTPVSFSWPGRFGVNHTLTVHQSSDEETWPGGALWDLGWYMGQLIVSLSMHGKSVATTTTTMTGGSASKGARRTIQLADRVIEALDTQCPHIFECDVVLELGCGVGLTGLIASAALGPRTTILTDLQVVIEKITHPNVLRNTTAVASATKRKDASSPSATSRTLTFRTIEKGRGQVVAMPLCWGNLDDETAVLNVLQQRLQGSNRSLTNSPSGSRATKKKHVGSGLDTNSGFSYKPDLILIGDVAYQHKPGAPSHFEALLSTLRKFVHDSRTIVLFGTRLRMPASADLLDMLLEEYEEIERLSAEEIDGTAFAHVKHGMTIHFLRSKNP